MFKGFEAVYQEHAQLEKRVQLPGKGADEEQRCAASRFSSVILQPVPREGVGCFSSRCVLQRLPCEAGTEPQREWVKKGLFQGLLWDTRHRAAARLIGSHRQLLLEGRMRRVL